MMMHYFSKSGRSLFLKWKHFSLYSLRYLYFYLFRMNPSSFSSDFSVGKSVLAAWVLFTSLFFLYFVGYPMIESKKITEAQQVWYNNGYSTAVNQAMSTFSGNTLQTGYNNGYGTAIVQLAQALTAQYNEGCSKPVPVTIGSGSVGIVSVDCLQKISNSASGKTAPTQGSPAPSR